MLHASFASTSPVLPAPHLFSRYKCNDESYFKAGKRSYGGAVVACHAVRYDGKGANEARTTSTLDM